MYAGSLQQRSSLLAANALYAGRLNQGSLLHGRFTPLSDLALDISIEQQAGRGDSRQIYPIYDNSMAFVLLTCSVFGHGHATAAGLLSSASRVTRPTAPFSSVATSAKKLSTAIGQREIIIAVLLTVEATYAICTLSINMAATMSTTLLERQRCLAHHVSYRYRGTASHPGCLRAATLCTEARKCHWAVWATVYWCHPE